MERGINPPPGEINVLEKLAIYFGLEHEEKLVFIDSAAMERHEIPVDLIGNPALMKMLPAFFRAARGHELPENQLQKFVEDIKKLHRPDKA